jgi:hypothetical protein
MSEPKTLHAWKLAHPHVNMLVFEANYNKRNGFGEFEIVCGWCLASHYFDDEPPEICRFCRAPIRETHIISNLPEILSQRWRVITIAKARPLEGRPER